ncbi:hypothetical protein B0A52_02286 [Exophiala mesophila]|uniref:Uncharacterized protein n=1 Tax=Exophiala mesophila TaxID=212818 RepID=A0A438NBK9_EXOME|nr:hypothetical protein B0A52_02286 [Exophiala mesophila]
MRFTTRRVSNGFPISEPRPARTPTESTTPSTNSTSTLPTCPRHPSLARLHKFRNIIVPILIMFVFTTLILGAIYAYCIAKPHTSIADQLARDPSAEANDSIFGKRQTSTDLFLEPAMRDAAATDESSTTDTSKDRESQPQTALMFYTLSAPTASLVHLAFELVMHHHNPIHLDKRAAYIVLIPSAILLAAGWITTLSFWMHCELPPLNATGQEVCPVQVRGHFMYGIHEVSIAKAVVGWLVVLAYLWHVYLLCEAVKAQKRIWRIQGHAHADRDAEHGAATEIVVSVSDQMKKETYLASAAR